MRQSQRQRKTLQRVRRVISSTSPNTSVPSLTIPVHSVSFDTLTYTSSNIAGERITAMDVTITDKN